MRSNCLKAIFLTLFVALCLQGVLCAQETVVEGLVRDGESGEALPYASVVFENSQIGTTTDSEGRFFIATTDLELDALYITYLGYDTRKVAITPGVRQIAEIDLRPDEKVLSGIDVVGERRVRKDTAANELFRKVVRHKPDNAPQEYDNYAYESYTKTVFGLWDVNEKFPSRIVVRKLPFVFENTDTLPDGTIVLPGLMKETYKQILFRKKPKRTKEYLWADRFSGVENHSISDLVEFNYEDIDIYSNTVNVNGKPIMSPFADNALINYKYFLTDTAEISGYYCYKLEFTGRSAKDNAFTGYAWIHDTTFAIKDILITLLPQANVNFISLFEVRQMFTRVDGQFWFKDYEAFQTNMNLFKKADKQNFMAKKESWRRNIVINHPAIDTLVEGELRVVVDGARDQSEEFWETVRMAPLTRQEADVFPIADSVLDTRIIKFLEWTLEALQSRYLGAGPVEFGQVDQLYSYNALEGPRLKLGIRTSTDLSKRFLLGGFGAYGFDDEAWKYGAFFNVHLKRKNELWHMLGLQYRYDYSFVGTRDRNDVHDNLLNVILRSDPIDNIFLSREASGFYEKEWMPGLSTKLDASHRTFYSVPGRYEFGYKGDSTGFTSTELGVEITWGKGLRYYESTSNFERTPITTVKPRLTLQYRTGVNRFIGGDVGYHRISAAITQKLLSPIGYTKYTLGGGRYFGQVPYPLLELHRGNESLYLEDQAFNVLNDFEFVSDTWVSLWFEHHFDGFLLNKVPGIRFLQLRTIFYYRGMFGWLSDRNASAVPLIDGMSGLNGHYSEIGFGLENILKLLRVDAIWRLTQKGKPDVQKWGIRFVISPKF